MSTAPYTQGFENLEGGTSLTGNDGDNVLDGKLGSNTLRGDPDNDGNDVSGSDTFIVWVPKDTAVDTISDFQLPRAGESGVVDRIIVKQRPETEGTPKASDPDGTDGIFTITTGSVSQTIALGVNFNEDDEIDDIIGDDGTGSLFLIFE